MFHRLLTLLALLCCLAGTAHSAAADQADPLAEGFRAPPPEVRPWVYWQWVNGNVSEDGIRKDLEWMNRVGLGGVFYFDIAFRSPPVPQYVERRIAYGTPEWERAIRVAATEAERLGLGFGAQSSGGWSVSGGPQVKPEHAMKKLVWSELVVAAGLDAPIRLPQPPAVNGPFQSVQIGEPHRQPSLYRDVAVIAYRLPEAEQRPRPSPLLSGVRDAALLADGDYDRSIELAPDASGGIALQAQFESGAMPRSFTIAVDGPMPKGTVEISQDGASFEPLLSLPGPAHQPAPVQTYALPGRTAPFWRLRFTGVTAPVRISELHFDDRALIHRYQEKAGYGVLTDSGASATPAVSAQAAVQPDTIVDLTRRMSADGSLDWRPREGRWAVLRFGWSLTGRRTVPATDESIGLEVDKLDPAAVRAFAESWYDRLASVVGRGGPMDTALTDSWEAGQQNWTPDMVEQFAARRGYDLRLWLPAVAGRIIGDAARSERFLADFRRTIADMLADHHYGVLAETARARGLTFYAEAAGTDLPTIIDGIQAKGRVDVPMGEYWFYPEGSEPASNHLADVREAASAAHVYGRRTVAVEALTTRGEDPWAMGPPQLRRIVDRFFAEGANFITLHTSAHQPFADRRPGITLRQYGQHFTRGETWAKDAGDWLRYLARTSFMLQQGLPVKDVAIFYGEDAPASPPFGDEGSPKRPSGYDYDYINAEALLTRASVKDGRLTLPDGMSYRLLVLPPEPGRMSLPLVRKLGDLVRDGAVLLGPKPIGAAGLAASDAEILSAADEIWETATPGAEPRAFGRGRIYGGMSVEDVLRAERVRPDLMPLEADASIHWSHRRTSDADIYFVSNQSAEPFSGTVRFRTSGRHAEIWNAVDGRRAPVGYSVANAATEVPLRLEPYASHFIVFRGQATRDKVELDQQARTPLIELRGPWRVSFKDGQGAPETMSVGALSSWADDANPAIRYYSGRATYSRAIDVPREWLAPGRRIELDLGRVAEIARVRINGSDLGTLWHAPYRLDISDALRPGRNALEIDVTNYWANRLIGDMQPGADPVTFTAIKPYGADAPLRPSGLLGPVRLHSAE